MTRTGFIGLGGQGGPMAERMLPDDPSADASRVAAGPFLSAACGG